MLTGVKYCAYWTPQASTLLAWGAGKSCCPCWLNMAEQPREQEMAWWSLFCVSVDGDCCFLGIRERGRWLQGCKGSSLVPLGPQTSCHAGLVTREANGRICLGSLRGGGYSPSWWGSHGVHGGVCENTPLQTMKQRARSRMG